jgi:hypothetical protein
MDIYRSLTREQIHIAKSSAPKEDVSTASKALKLMHRFTPEQVEAKMDQAESK